MTAFSRRGFLRRAGAASAGVLVPGALDALLAGIAHGATGRAYGYGPLVRDPDGLLDLPQGFAYRALSTAILGMVDDPRWSGKLDGGAPVPARHDGMASFPGPDGGTILVRNHELDPGHVPAVPADDGRRFDELGTGGTTTLWVDAERRLTRSFASLAGTFRNCAGGATPWGSWLTCEECTYTPGPTDAERFDQTPEVRERHGWIFEVDARAERAVDPAPIHAMGRFYHEAVAVDPKTGFVYLTEDRSDGLIYRYRPDVVVSRRKKPSELQVGDLALGGSLEALTIARRPGASTRNWEGTRPEFPLGRSVEIGWVRIPNPDPDVDMERDPDDHEDDPLRRRARTAPTSIRAQGHALGATRFARGEGACFHGRSLYVACTNGGREKSGQIWRLDVDAQRLTLAVEPDNREILDGPDNVMLAPFGDLLVCEDGRGDNHVIGVTKHGSVYPLARNAYNRSELAGACFSPDGQTLFFNLQEPGVTFAVWGPWERRRA